MTRKQTLLKKYKDLGFSDQHVAWMAKRYTADQIQNAIDNVEAMGIIEKVARNTKNL